MGILDTLFESVVKVGAGLLGLALLLGGAQQSTTGGNETLGVILFLAGIVLLVFAVRL